MKQKSNKAIRILPFHFNQSLLRLQAHFFSHEVNLLCMLWQPPKVTLVETSKVVVISYAWLYPACLKNVISSKQWHKPTTQKSQLFYNWRIFIIESSNPNNFFIRKLLFRLQNHCKNIYWFSWRYYDFYLLWQDVATECVRPKTNTTPFEVTTQDKISQWANIQVHTVAGQPEWCTEVAETYIAIANYVSPIRGRSRSWRMNDPLK